MCFMLCLVGAVSAAHADTLVLSDNFNSYPVGAWAEGTTRGNFFVNFTGYGSVSIVKPSTTSSNRMIELKPMASTTASETHAALLTTVGSWGDFDTTVTMTTVQQLRTGSAPNTWETAWFVWHYIDNDHFYYFTLKTNGWEFGKRDPAYAGGQRFIATGNTPALTIGTPTIVRVRQVGRAMGIYLNNGAQVAYFEDETPYLSGKVGFYTEDAQVRFDNLSVYIVP
jgi:hypothetical protein